MVILNYLRLKNIKRESKFTVYIETFFFHYDSVINYLFVFQKNSNAFVLAVFQFFLHDPLVIK
jgi:hypothetical protein